MNARKSGIRFLPRRPSIPWMVFGLGLVLTAAATGYIAASTAGKDRDRFNYAVQYTRDEIDDRVGTYTAMLHGGAGLFAATPQVNASTFRAYVDRLAVNRRYPGIGGIGFIRRLPAEAIEDLSRQMDREGVTCIDDAGKPQPFHVWPVDPPREEYYSILYLEPLDERNRAAIGFDMFHEPTRRAAMERARDTGEPAATARVTLIQEIDAQKQAGFLIYVPLYQGGVTPPTLEQRRSQLIGFIYSPFRVDDFLRGMLRAAAPLGVALDIYDGAEPDAQHQMHRSIRSTHGGYRPRFSQTTQLDVAGRPWTLHFTTQPEFDRDAGSPLLPLVPIAGTIISLILFRVMRAEIHATAAAESAAAGLRSSTAALASSEGRLRRLVESNLMGIVFARIDGRITGGNEAFFNLIGHSRDETVAGQLGFDRLTPPEYFDVDRRAVEELNANGVAVPFEKEFIRPDGQRVPVLVGMVMLDAAAGDCVGLCIDLTDRKAAERERLDLLAREQAARQQAEAAAVENARLYRVAQDARAEAERANRLKDEFLATVSHELRTPLNAILGWSQLLRGGAMDRASVQQGLDTIERNSRAQAQLIEDLLDVSRIITGKLRLDVHPVELAPILEATLSTVHPAAEARKIRIERDIDPAPIRILGDPDRLQQIIWNLLSNSIKFTPMGGQVTVRLHPGGPDAELVVTDNGRGIDPAFLPYVFSAFRQADASLTRKHGGLGLGLAIVRHLVELHGGTVSGESPGVGKGASFTVRLPLRLPGAGEAEAAAAAAASDASQIRDGNTLEGVRVLVVDDDPDARDLLGRILESARADSVLVDSADAALVELPRFRPHLLLSDIAMPGQSGYDLIRHLRGLPPDQGGDIPAIAVTAFARIEDRSRALQEGFQCHLPKPIDPIDLIQSIAHLTGRDRHLPQ